VAGQQPHTLLINELMAAPAGGAEEWVELYNLGGAAVDTTGWSLECVSVQGRVSTRLLEETTVAPGRWQVQSFGSGFLPNDGASVVLRDAAGQAVGSAVLYPPLEHMQVYARAGDGADTWSAEYPASPGAPNVLPAAVTLPAPADDAAPNGDGDGDGDGGAGEREPAGGVLDSPVSITTTAATSATTTTVPLSRTMRQPRSLRLGVQAAARPYAADEAGQVYRYGADDAAADTSPAALADAAVAPMAAQQEQGRGGSGWYLVLLIVGVVLLALALGMAVVLLRQAHPAAPGVAAPDDDDYPPQLP
jgi:hypothetical protein